MHLRRRLAVLVVLAPIAVALSLVPAPGASAQVLPPPPYLPPLPPEVQTVLQTAGPVWDASAGPACNTLGTAMGLAALGSAIAPTVVGGILPIPETPGLSPFGEVATAVSYVSLLYGQGCGLTGFRATYSVCGPDEQLAGTFEGQEVPGGLVDPTASLPRPAGSAVDVLAGVENVTGAPAGRDQAYDAFGCSTVDLLDFEGITEVDPIGVPNLDPLAGDAVGSQGAAAAGPVVPAALARSDARVPLASFDGVSAAGQAALGSTGQVAAGPAAAVAAPASADGGRDTGVLWKVLAFLAAGVVIAAFFVRMEGANSGW
jgi:hypothetical protein